MNLKELRNLSKFIIRKVRCSNCGMNKFIVSDENYNAYDLDVMSKCCKKPDYRL